MDPVQLPLGIRLRDDATFHNFYPEKNGIALGYIERMCDVDGCEERLIYLWGLEGAGKTHLLQAACMAFEHRGRRAIYLPLTELADHDPRLLDDLDRCELVCLDDLQAITGRDDWEESLFHLFNRLQMRQGCLLMSASVSPRELAVRLSDLQSRFSQALVFQLMDLSEEGKLRALQLRASRRGLMLSEEVGLFILNRSARDMAALFELLETLDRISLQTQRRLTIPFVKKALDW